jgi:hypothetical protein
MRMRCWVSAALLACTAAAASGGPAAPVQADQAAPGRTRLTLADAEGRAVTLLVSRDKRVPQAAAPGRPTRVGDVAGTAVIVVDTYPSRLSGGAGQCGAGEEQFLRVVRLTPAPVRQTFQLKLASCWDELELKAEAGQGGLTWKPEAGELTIEWLSGPKGGPEKRRLRIARDGKVETLAP